MYDENSRLNALFDAAQDVDGPSDLSWMNTSVPVNILDDELVNIAPATGIHPTAVELVAGIAQAAENRIIKAWGNKPHDFKPFEKDGSHLTCCPAHDDHNPSFVATDSLDAKGNPKVLITCRAGCSQDRLIAALDDLGLWNRAPGTIEVPEAMRDTKASAAQRPIHKKSTAIIPVPSDALPPPNDHYQLGPIAKRWAYRSSTGELAFYVCRFDPNPVWLSNFEHLPKGRVEAPDGKSFRPLSYCQTEDGNRRWSWIAPSSDIPLYNAHKLAANPAAKVIVCEGEKASDAAQMIFPERVAITWYSGAKAVSKAPWAMLSRRDVLIWPDHDGAGSSAAQALLKELRQVGVASVAVLDVEALGSMNPIDPDGLRREPPPKWDAADALLENRDYTRLKAEIERLTNPLPLRAHVEVSADNIGETANLVETIVLESGLPIYRRGNALVRVGRFDEKSADGKSQQSLAMHSLNMAGLGETLESVIIFERFDARKNGLKPTHAPELLLKTLLERGKLSGLRPLVGITDIPLVRQNGTLLDIPGYDEETGIFYKPSNLALNLPANPTRDDAMAGTATFKHLFRDFPFKTEVDLSAAISAVISAVNRPTLGATPLHALSAPTPGSGKSLLATLVTIIATGSTPSFITQGEDEEELEKRVSAQMMAGRSIINIDNADRPIKGAALCNLLTSDKVSLRVLGKSETLDITSSSFILANGNNMRVANDMVRRTVLCQLDPGVERPEEREIVWDAKAEARANRGTYVSASLTILRAYQAAGAPKQKTPLGSFEGWSRLVRDALIWAGLPDPHGNAEVLADADPDKERFIAIAEQWTRNFGNQWMKVSAVIAQANLETTASKELKMALGAIAGSGHDISANRFGMYLSRFADRPIVGFKFVSRKVRSGLKEWKLEKQP